MTSANEFSSAPKKRRPFSDDEQQVQQKLDKPVIVRPSKSITNHGKNEPAEPSTAIAPSNLSHIIKLESSQESPAYEKYSWGGNTGKHDLQLEKDLAFVLFVTASLKQCPFKLATKMKDAEKFYDVVFFKEDPKEVWLFQVKHSTASGDRSGITSEDLFPKDLKRRRSFTLSLYIQSYLNIRQNASFKGYTPKMFFFTNKSLKITEDLVHTKLQTVDDILQWSRSDNYYVNLEPQKDAMQALLKQFNNELIAVRDGLIQLFKTGTVSDVLLKYKTPLRKVMLLEKGMLLLSDTSTGDYNNASYEWLITSVRKHVSQRQNEIVLVAEVDKSLKDFFRGHSRAKHLPMMVKEEHVRDFFANLVFCVDQQSDLCKVVDDLVTSWMRQNFRPDELGSFGDVQRLLPGREFREVFDRWHEQHTKRSRFLSFDREGMSCVQNIIDKLKRSTRNTSSNNFYINRAVIKRSSRSNEKQNSLKAPSDTWPCIYETIMEDEEFIELLNTDTDNKCYALIGGPGTGKTGLVQHIAFEIQKRTSKDVCIVYLNKLRTKREHIVENDDDSNIANIFGRYFSQDGLNFPKTILGGKINRTLIVFDGFDEIEQSLRSSLIAAIKYLLSKSNTQIIITGRNHVQETLETEFSVYAMKMKAFEHDEQINLLAKMWNVQSDLESKSRVFADNLLGKLNLETGSSIPGYNGHPLIVRMLAEVFKEELERFLTSDIDTYIFFENFNILSLFEKFVVMSFNITLRKKVREDAYSYFLDKIDEELEPIYERFILEHQLIAIQHLEIKELQKVVESLKYSKVLDRFMARVERGKELSLLIDLSSNNGLKFIHLGYAEYFVAKFLIEHIFECESSLLQILQNEAGVRKFFFSMVEQNESELGMMILSILYVQDSIVAYWACLGGNQKIARWLLQNTGINTNEPYHQILLHAAADGGSVALILFLLKELRMNVDATLKIYHKETNLKQGDTAIHVAARKNNLNIVEQLADHGANTNTINTLGQTPLWIAADSGHLEVVKLLIDKGANFHTPNNDGWTPLNAAASKGHLEVVKLLIAYDANVHTPSNKGWTPINSAAANGYLEVVKLLIENDANVHTSNNKGWTPINSAASEGQLKVVKLLIENYSNVYTPNDEGDTPVSSAAANGHLEAVTLLIEKSANIHTPNNYGWSPVNKAAANGHLEVVKLLINHCADINTQNHDGWTPVNKAAANGHLEVVKLLINHCVDNNTPNNYGWTSINKAAANGHLEVVKFLIENYANVDTPSNNGFSPINSAASEGQLEIVKLLLENGANVDTPNNKGWTPINSAAMNGYFEVVKLLIENGANVHTPSNREWPPINSAASEGHFEVVKLLLENGVNINTPNKYGHTPINSAAANGHLSVVKLLFENGANVHTPNNDGDTPVSSAAANGHFAVVKLLIENGAVINTTNNDGWTPVSKAAANGHLEIVKLLIGNHSDIHKPSNDGQTPFNSAGHLEVVKLLIDKRAALHSQSKDVQITNISAAANGKQSIFASNLCSPKIKQWLDKLEPYCCLLVGQAKVKVKVFKDFWKQWKTSLSDLLIKMEGNYLEQTTTVLLDQLLEIVRQTVYKKLQPDGILNFFRTFNDLLVDIKELSFEWFVRVADENIKDSVLKSGFINTVDNKFKNTADECYLVQGNCYEKFVETFANSSIPEHYQLKIITTFLDYIIAITRKTTWNNVQKMKPLTEIDQLNATIALINGIRSSLLYLKEQPEYVDFGKYYEETVNPFNSVIEKSECLESFTKRVALIADSFWFIRNQNSIGIDKALRMFASHNDKFDEELKAGFIRYNQQFEKYMCDFSESSSTEKIQMIVENIRSMVQPKAFSEWTTDFKKNTVPRILAGLGAVWSIIASTDIESSRCYLKPHIFQIISVLRLLCVDDPNVGIEKHLMQVLTGQGKSVILGLVAAVLALFGQDVVVVCYSEYLASRDLEDFMDLYVTFSIDSKISYKTFDNMVLNQIDVLTEKCKRYIEKCIGVPYVSEDIWEDVKDFDKSVLLIDEVDVFFMDNFYGNTHNSVCRPIVPGIAEIQRKIWELLRINRSNVEDQIAELLKSSKSSEIEQFKLLLNKQGSYTLIVNGSERQFTNKLLFSDHLKEMINTARKVYDMSMDDLILNYRLEPNGLVAHKDALGVFSTDYINGYYNTFAYFKLKNKNFVECTDEGMNYGYLVLDAVSFSYAKLPENYPLIVGVTGTLTGMTTYEKRAIECHYNIMRRSIMPSFYGSSNLKFDELANFKCLPDESNWQKEIFTKINSIVEAQRSVIVFFDSEKETSQFRRDFEYRLNRLVEITVNTEKETRKRYINEAGLSRTVTLATREMGRGVDYKSSLSVEKHGGIHIIQTFFSVDEKEETQIKGRTARKDNRGSYELIVCQAHLLKLKLISEEDNSSEISYALLRDSRNRLALSTSEDKVKKLTRANELHEKSINFIRNL